ncbi:uncharacterized protein EI97DRAFT_224177 [Westerdykella ornata]|uniref:DNA-directed RNA polymerase III subunit RPC9 n=1 Tax=Westerdykella ornata TaxID=318751 RepID=A0A6A6JQM5_WESOR|nr:uncharacterized protein EI97DRAFT_224177 [Westerdykella ornata]KAF2278950.1 hypothetical protein EI97DRAFT_224177 [Westerdykella ornata]
MPCRTNSRKPLKSNRRTPGLQITNPQSALLSNHEVLLHLQEQEAEYTGTDGTGRKREKPAGLKDCLRDTLEYLSAHDHNCTLASPTQKHPSRPTTLYKGPHSLFRALAPHYRLNKAEFLQLYNLRPTTEVELQVVLEEYHTRFTDAQLAHMLEVIRQVFEEDESSIPDGVEDLHMEKVANKLEGAGATRRVKRRAV